MEIVKPRPICISWIQSIEGGWGSCVMNPVIDTVNKPGINFQFKRAW
jgi:hypothetical protein